MKKTILHIIPKLVPGGSEKQMYLLIGKTHKTYNHIVINIFGGNKYLAELQAIGVKVCSLQQLIKEYRFHNIPNRNLIILGWLYYGGIFALLLKLSFFKNSHVLVTIRQCIGTKFSVGYKGLLSIHLLNVFRKYIGLVIYNSKESHDTHQGLLSKIKKQEIIFNLLTSKKEPKLISRRIMNVGFIGRNDPVKNIDLAIKIFENILSNVESITIIGDGLKNYRLPGKLKNHVKVVDDQRRFECSISALDCVFITSYNESFPNVLIESIQKGIVPICAPIPSILDLLGNSIFIVEKYSVASFIKTYYKIKNSCKNEINSELVKCFNMINDKCDEQIILDKWEKIFRNLDE